MCARGNPTGWSTGVRSAGVAAITSHHLLYWPPPIGFLLNLKRMRLFLLGGSNLKASVSLKRDKGSILDRTTVHPCMIKRQLDKLYDNIIYSFLISFTVRRVSYY